MAVDEKLKTKTASRRTLLRGAGVLAVCALLAKLIGALYRIPLTNIIGTEGIGLYQMVFPLYTVLLTVSSGGLPVAISRVVSERMAKGDEAGARRVLFTSLASLALIGGAGAGVIALFRHQIAAVQGNAGAALAYLGIAPSIAFVAIIAAFRGYYQGKQNMLPSALSQLTEQIVKLAAGLTLARLLLPYGVAYGVLGAVLGVSASELITMLLLAGQFLFTDARYKKSVRVPLAGLSAEAAADIALPPAAKRQPARAVLKEIYRVAIPVTFGSLVMPLTQVIDSLLVINLLTAGGMERTAATAAFGLLTGPVNTLLNMPVVVTLSFAVALLPKVSACFFKKESADAAIAESLKWNWVIGLAAALCFAVFGREILSVLYARSLSAAELATGTALLLTGSVSVVYICFLQVATSVLQGTNRAHKPAVNLLCGASVKVLLTLVLLPFFGLMGAMAASCACYGVTCVLDIRAMRKVSCPKLTIRAFLIGPLFAGAGFSATGFFLVRLFIRFMPTLLAVVAAAAAALVPYCALLFLFGTIKISELKGVPIIGKLLNRRKADARQPFKNP